jgi:hypothetical protein
MKTCFTFILMLISLLSKADQLAWVTREQAKEATDLLLTQSVVISWCACCENSDKTWIKISNAYFKPVTSHPEYYEVFIQGVDSDNKSINESFDLAYLHYQVNGMAVCLATGLGFECDPCTQPFEWPYATATPSSGYVTSSNSPSTDKDGFEYVGTATDGAKYSVLVQKANSYSTEVWVKSTNPLKTVKNSKGKFVKVGGGYTLTYLTANCEEREYNTEQRVVYNYKGEVTKTDKFGSYGDKGVPRSVMAAIFLHICSR